MPTLKLVHTYPEIYAKFVTDQGAIKFVLKGANVMCRGLTNEEGYMDDVDKDTMVSVYVKGHDHALVSIL